MFVIKNGGVGFILLFVGGVFGVLFSYFWLFSCCFGVYVLLWLLVCLWYFVL